MSDVIEQLLGETDMVDDTLLRDFLVELEEAATSVRPLPSAELAALLVPVPRRSAGRRGRVIITTMIVVGTIGAGATAAAASPEVRDATGRAIQTVVGALLPAVPTAPSPGSSPAPVLNKPAPRHTSNTGHPGPTDHPGNTDRPGNTDHPGPSDHPENGSTQGNSNSQSASPHPGEGSNGQP